MSYDIPGYDGWKLSTPWDDETVYYVDFDCSECDEFNSDIEAVGGKRADEVFVECAECGFMNCVDVGRDE